MNLDEVILEIRYLNNKCKDLNINFSFALVQAGVDIKKQPYVFKSSEEFNIAIREATTKLNNDLSIRLSDIDDAITKSVTGNTFRAFPFRRHGIKNISPSGLYRQIVKEIFASQFDYFVSLNTVEGYQNFVIESAKKIASAFDETTGLPEFMGFGRAAKLFNLSCKAILRYEKVTQQQQQELLKFYQIPWDSYTLQGIRELAPEFRIPNDVGMGWAWLNDIDNYKKLQQWIRAKTMQTQHYPIHYEVAAWDLSH